MTGLHRGLAAWLLGAASLWPLASPAMAADAAAAAAMALAEGRYEQACSETSTLPATPEGWFVRGRCAVHGDRIDEAIDWFARILQVVDAPRTRLELARALVRAGRPAQAREQFEGVLRSGPPEPIRSWVLAELAELGPADPNATAAAVVAWRVGVGGLHDTNANAGPGDPAVNILGLPFQLSDESLGRADAGVMGWVGVERHSPTRWGLWSLAARLDATDYRRLSPLSYGAAVLQSALRQPYGAYTLNWSLGAQRVRQRSGQGRDGVFAGLTASREWAQGWGGSAGFTAGRNRLPLNRDGASRLASAELALRRAGERGLNLAVGLRWARETSALPDQSHDDLGIVLSAEGAWPALCGTCRWTTSASHGRMRFRSRDLLFDILRRDRLTEWSLAATGAAPLLAAGRAAAIWRLSADRAVSDSTLAMQTYRRTRPGASVEWVF